MNYEYQKKKAVRQINENKRIWLSLLRTLKPLGRWVDKDEIVTLLSKKRKVAHEHIGVAVLDLYKHKLVEIDDENVRLTEEGKTIPINKIPSVVLRIDYQ